MALALFARKQKLDTVSLKGHDSLSFSARWNVTLKTPMRASVWSERKFFKGLNARHSKKTGNASQLNFAFQTYFFAYSAFDFAVAREPLSHAAQRLTESWQPIRINDNAIIQTLPHWMGKVQKRTTKSPGRSASGKNRAKSEVRK